VNFYVVITEERVDAYSLGMMGFNIIGNPVASVLLVSKFLVDIVR